MNDGPAPLDAWIGRQETLDDVATAAPLDALDATLCFAPAPGRPPARPGDPVPPLRHWLYFTPRTPHHGLGPDGHARRGDFLPPVPLPRRMWAGGRLQFGPPLRVGDALQRTSTIADVKARTGRSGPLVFVTVRHDIRASGGGWVQEEHDIVYREAPDPAAASESDAPDRTDVPMPATHSMTVVPDAVLLFRYSALTFNGHRIHYDRRYVTDVEGYPGLVVHGPLIATLLLDLGRTQAPHRHVAAFRFQARRPVFDTAPFTLHAQADPAADTGSAWSLWACDPAGQLAMQARIQFADGPSIP